MNMYLNGGSIAFSVLNADLECASIVNVEIRDNINYKNIWVTYDPSGLQYDQYWFHNTGSKFSAPITIQITLNYNGTDKIMIGKDVINDLSPGSQFDFGSNLCIDIPSNNTFHHTTSYVHFNNVVYRRTSNQ
eukprot:501659_1